MEEDDLPGLSSHQDHESEPYSSEEKFEFLMPLEISDDYDMVKYHDWRDALFNIGFLPNSDGSSLDLSGNKIICVGKNPRSFLEKKFPCTYVHCDAHESSDMNCCPVRWKVYYTSGDFVREMIDPSFVSANALLVEAIFLS